MRKLYLATLMLCCGFAQPSWAEFTVIVEQPTTEADQFGHQLLKESSIDTVISGFMHNNFTPIDNLTLTFAALPKNDEDVEFSGPYYDPEIQNITIPYQFFSEVMQRFEADNYQETGLSPEDGTIDAVLHTFFHELAHALIHIYDIPVLGKEEDAADGLADVMLIEYFDEGQEIAISAADLFDLESQDQPQIDDHALADEHSLDAQRFYATLCHVFGSNPDKYSYIPENLALDDNRAELCIEEYQNLTRSVHTLLADYLLEKEASK